MKKRPRLLTATAAFALAVVTATALAGSSLATKPGQNGRIAYMVLNHSTGLWQTWVANADLSGATQLTRSRRSNSGWAVWSPDGKRLAFDSDRSDRTPFNARHVNDIFVMNADGTGVKKLTNSKGVSEFAAWSPDGSSIAYDHGSGKGSFRTGIYVMRNNGQHRRRLTSPGPHLSDSAPRFSPDGSWIAFTRRRGQEDHAPAAIFVMHSDGTHLTRLTPFSMRAGEADWSPDGTQILFDATPNSGSGGNGDVYVMSATGGPAVNLTNNPVSVAGSDNAAWSPDGTEIVFVDNRYVNGVGTTGLATMNPDGSNRQFFLTQTVDAGEPDWQSIPAAPAAPRTSAPRSTPLRFGGS